MDEAVQFLVQHGYLLLFAWVLVEQLGLPIPAIPLLLAAGALAGSGRMDLAVAVGLSLIAVVLADVFWYCLGRYRGGRMLKLLCRIHSNPTRAFGARKMFSFGTALILYSSRSLSRV